MKKNVFFALCLALFFWPGNAPAELYQTHTWELGGEIYYFKYKEPDIMQDTGLMYGISGSYAYHKNVMLKVEGRAAWGKVDYSSTDSGDTSNISDYVLELRLLAGYDFMPTDSVAVTPFIGAAYRYLYDDFGGHVTTAGLGGYDRVSNYYYSPVGITAVVNLSSEWSAGGTAEYDIFWWGRQKSYLSDAGGTDHVNQQNKGYGARGSFFIRKKEKGFNVFCEPFIRYWNIEKSEVSSVYEPDNNTTETGVRLGVQF